MKLSRIRITGFKSFADSVELPFDEGMTAIVGPNGCGKSNVSDSVRWVLGEQRARLLRSQRMEEVIFHGAVRHRPVNVAEVALVFDNSDATLPIAYSEVEVSRSGQSEYLINQSPVRLRDVQDLLRGTGLGSDAGVVIEAQMIDRLLSDKADERRSLFEEAAGIGLYRDRKTSTERQLARTTDDLQRLDDIINEVQREVRSLARQRGRAERHAKFTAERFAVVMTVARRDFSRITERRVELDGTTSDLSERLPRGRAAIAARERDREAAVQARHTAEARRSEMERRLAEARLDVERLDGELRLAEERLQNASARKARAQSERAVAAERAALAERDRDAAATEHAAAAEARISVQTELDVRTAREDETKGHLVAARTTVRETGERLQELAERSRALAGERVSLDRDLTDLRTASAEAGRVRAARRSELDAAERLVRDVRTQADERREADRAAEAEVDRARHALAAAREHEEAIRSERRSAEEGLARFATRRDALEQLERDREGLAPAARALLEARDRFGVGAVLGPLSDFVRTSRADAELAERLLGEWLHAVLVRDRAAIDAIRAWHSATELGSLVLLPAAGPLHAGAGDMPLPLTATGPGEAWARTLLAGTDVLEPGGGALQHANGAVVLAGSGTSAGPLARRADLEHLSDNIDNAQRRVEILEQQQREAGRARAAAETLLAEAAAGGERARAAFRDAQSAVDESARVLQRVQRELAEADERCRRLEEHVAQRTARLAEVAGELDGTDADHARLEAQLHTSRTALADVEAQQETARERRVHWQVEEAQVSAREQAAQERAERAAQTMAAARAEMAALDRELGDIGRDSEGVAEQQQQRRDTLAERHVAIHELEAAVASAVTAVEQADALVARAERAIEEARTAAEALSEQSHRIDIERTELEGKRLALVERIEGEWHKPIHVLLDSAEDVAGDLATLREQATHLSAEIERIGPVNALAVEEHAEETARLEFLTTQREDLVAARDKLREALREIEQTARAMFVETFAAIRDNFREVFLTLFEGGECDVRLADPSDPLGSEIDISAAPRGKRTQRIHLLSSGERALVAISLLFAIYLTKPSPFCLLDEVDAPLDDANVVRFIRLISEFKQDTQFIVITHNPRTMQVADAVYGITMQEPGVSTIVGVRLGELGAV